MGITLPWKAQSFTIFYPKMGAGCRRRDGELGRAGLPMARGGLSCPARGRLEKGDSQKQNRNDEGNTALSRDAGAEHLLTRCPRFGLVRERETPPSPGRRGRCCFSRAVGARVPLQCQNAAAVLQEGILLSETEQKPGLLRPYFAIWHPEPTCGNRARCTGVEIPASSSMAGGGRLVSPSGGIHAGVA